MLRMYDFYCDVCDIRIEALVDKDTESIICGDCDLPAKKAPSAPKLQTIINDPVRQSAALRKRSRDHSFKEAKRNQEQLASKLGGKPKSQTPWNIRNKGK